MPTQADKRLHQKLDSFWQSALPQQRDTLERFLSTKPPMKEMADNVIPPAEEARIRLELAQQLQDAIRKRDGRDNWRFTATHLSVIFAMPIDMLRQMASSNRHPTIGMPVYPARWALDLASDLAKEFLSILSLETDAAILPLKVTASRSSKRTKTSSGIAATSQKRTWEDSATRKEAEAKKCRDREKNACLFTGTANPEACHIIPFAFNSTIRNTNRTITLIPAMLLFGNRPWDQLLSNVGSSDYAWNMLAVNRQLHAWWGMGLWAVKCLGIMPAGTGPQHIVTLQFRWMPKRSQLPRIREINLENGEGQKMLDELTTWYGDPGTQSKDGGIVAASDVQSHQPLLSGQVFHVTLDSKEDAERMKDMVDLQWSLIVVASLAGAGHPSELLNDDDSDDGSDYDAMEVNPHDNSIRVVQQWLEGLEASASPGEQPDLAPSKDTTAG